MNFRAILFDFDGTLTPSLPLWVKAFHIALRHYDIELSDEEVVRRCFFRDWNVVAEELNIGSGSLLEERVVHEGLPKAFETAALFPYAKPVIEHCRAHHMQTALVTSAPRSMIDLVIPRLELNDLFDFTICAEEVTDLKPHPEPVQKALAALQRAPNEAIMVGDSTVDMLSGKAAGTKTALFMPPGPSHFHDPDALRATGPDHIFTHHRELPALLGLPALI